MLVLALDTSTPAVTAGVCRLDPADTEHRAAGAELQITTLAVRVTEDARAHAELLTPHILECLDSAGFTAAELDAVVVGVGPGPFTGLRVGMATAAAFADAIGVPVHGVCSLDGLAARARAAGVTGDVVVVTDARRREAYHARYDDDGVRTSGPIVGPAADIALDGARPVGDPVRIAEIPDAVAATATAPGPATAAATTTDAAAPGASATTGAAAPDAAAAGTVAASGLASTGPDIDALTSPDPAGLVAVAAADLLAGATPAPLEPLYLRRPDAVPPKRVEPSHALRGVQR